MNKVLCKDGPDYPIFQKLTILKLNIFNIIYNCTVFINIVTQIIWYNKVINGRMYWAINIANISVINLIPNYVN